MFHESERKVSFRFYLITNQFILSRLLTIDLVRYKYVTVQFSHSVVSNFLPWTVTRQASLSITNSQSLLKLMPIKSVMPSNHLILCPILLLPSIFPSTRVFSSESVLRIRWTKYWNFSFSISPSNEYSRTDFLLEELVGSPCCPRDSQQSSPTPQFKGIHSSALSFLYSPTLTSIHDYWKIIALTRWTFVGKVMSLLFTSILDIHASPLQKNIKHPIFILDKSLEFFLMHSNRSKVYLYSL